MATSKPSMSGSITSSTISCGLKAATAASASAPVPADSTSKPWKRRAIEITSTMFGSSSTTSTRCGLSVVHVRVMVGAESLENPGSSLGGDWTSEWDAQPTPSLLSGAHAAALGMSPPYARGAQDRLVATPPHALRGPGRPRVRSLRLPRPELGLLLLLAAC